MNHRRRLRLGLVGSALLVASISAAVPTASAAAVTPRPAGGSIVYVDGEHMYTIHPDGSGTTRVHARCCFTDPAWSRDGTKIAVGGRGIYTMRADGSHEKQLTAQPHDYNPSWSPDGRRLVFERHGDKGSAIFRINANGSGLTRLTNWRDVNYAPAWSPDSSKIAYDVVQEPGGGIHTMRPDGSDKRFVTDQTVNAYDLAWSPDGQKLALSGGNSYNDIYTVNADGSGLTQLTSYGENTSRYGIDENPSWSPDGTQIVFNRIGHEGRSAIFRMNADGTGVLQLTDWLQEARSPSWGRTDPRCHGHSATIVGTPDDDVLTGRGGQDVIVGLGGDDVIDGRGANDIACGNAGSDTIYGSTGNDVLYGGGGDDHLYGNRGDDVLRGGYGTDSLDGGLGADTLRP